MITFTPVRERPDVLEVTLPRLVAESVEVWAYDDNEDPESSALLRDAGVRILPPIDLPPHAARHVWPEDAVLRVAAIKTYAIELFLAMDEEHLFLVDSDVAIQAGTTDHLREADVPVIAAVYWSRWEEDGELMPNVWDYGTYGFAADVARFREDGHRRVAGLGACTLVRRDVLPVARFEPIPGWPLWGEDRWFCLRAAVHGVPLFACSCVEAQPWHIYRPSEDLVIGETWDTWAAAAWRRLHSGGARIVLPRDDTEDVRGVRAGDDGTESLP